MHLSKRSAGELLRRFTHGNIAGRTAAASVKSRDLSGAFDALRRVRKLLLHQTRRRFPATAEVLSRVMLFDVLKAVRIASGYPHGFINSYEFLIICI